MVNRAATRRVEKAIEAQQEEFASLKTQMFQRGWFKDKEPQNIRIFTPWEWHFVLAQHSFGKKGGLRKPALCDIHQYGERECKLCELDTEYGPNKPKFIKVSLAYFLDQDGETFKSQGKKFLVCPIQILCLEKGGQEGENWDQFETWHENKSLYRNVIQIKKSGKRGMLTPSFVDKEVLREQYGSSMPIPEEWKEKISEFDEDMYVAHILNAFSNVDWDYWQVEQPTDKVEWIPAPQDADGMDPDDDDDDKAAKRKGASSKSNLGKPKTTTTSRRDDDEAPRKKRPASQDDEDDEAPRKRRKADDEE